MCFLSGHVLKVSENESVFSSKCLLINTSTKFKQPYAALATEANFNLLNVKLLQSIFEKKLCKSYACKFNKLIGLSKALSFQNFNLPDKKRS